MRNVFIAGNALKPGCREAAGRLAAHLRTRGAQVAGQQFNREVELPAIPLDLVVSLGGDGSLLRLVEPVIARGVPVLGLQLGHLGFLTAGLAEEGELILDAWLEGRTRTFEHMALEAELQVPGAAPVRTAALNDVVIASADMCRVLTLQVRLGDEPLQRVRADGLILSTPTGSTAHSLSAGGPAVDPRLEAMLLTPISSQSLSSRPLVVPPSACIEVAVPEAGVEAPVICDGRRLGCLGAGGRLLISRHPQNVRLVFLEDFKFARRLREKLGWSRDFFNLE